MSATQTDDTRRASQRRIWDSVWIDLALALAVPFLLVLPTGVLDVPPTVDAITFENPTVYDIGIEVTGDGRGWTSVTTVGHGATHRVREVIDQGENWRFRFSSQARSGGEVTISRVELEASRWRLRVPPGIGAHLADQGAPLPPP